MKKLFLLTIDCDLRSQDIGARQESLDELLKVFSETGIAGHMTWMLNENDFSITEHHESFLNEILNRGDTIGVHDHYEFLKGRYEKDAVLDFCGRSKKRVEDWLERNGYKREIILHRNGCLVQNETVYTALKELGYTTVSDVLPGKKFPDRYGYPAFDNKSIPVGIHPYRHDTANFLNYLSSQGHFLHIPMSQMGLQFFDFDLLDCWIESFMRKSIETGVIGWLFHPYEIMYLEICDDRRTISPDFVAMLRSNIERLTSEYGVTFVSVDEVVSLL